MAFYARTLVYTPASSGDTLAPSSWPAYRLTSTTTGASAATTAPTPDLTNSQIILVTNSSYLYTGMFWSSSSFDLGDEFSVTFEAQVALGNATLCSHALSVHFFETAVPAAYQNDSVSSTTVSGVNGGGVKVSFREGAAQMAYNGASVGNVSITSAGVSCVATGSTTWTWLRVDYLYGLVRMYRDDLLVASHKVMDRSKAPAPTSARTWFGIMGRTLAYSNTIRVRNIQWAVHGTGEATSGQPKSRLVSAQRTSLPAALKSHPELIECVHARARACTV